MTSLECTYTSTTYYLSWTYPGTTALRFRKSVTDAEGTHSCLFRGTSRSRMPCCPYRLHDNANVQTGSWASNYKPEFVSGWRCLISCKHFSAVSRIRLTSTQPIFLKRSVFLARRCSLDPDRQTKVEIYALECQVSCAIMISSHRYLSARLHRWAVLARWLSYRDACAGEYILIPLGNFLELMIRFCEPRVRELHRWGSRPTSLTSTSTTCISKCTCFGPCIRFRF